MRLRVNALNIADTAELKPLSYSVDFTDGGYRVHLKQALNQNEIVNSDVEFEFFRDHIELIGRWVFGEPLSTGEMPKESSELLLLLSNEFKKQNLLPTKIQSIRTGYAAGAATGGKTKATACLEYHM